MSNGKNGNVAIILVVVCLAIVCLFIIIKISKQPKISCYNEKSVFEKFECKKDLESKLTKAQQARQHLLDSLVVSIRVMLKNEGKFSKEDYSKIEDLKQAYAKQKELFEQENQDMINTYNKEIFKQMDEYIQQYAEKYGDNYLFGYNSTGSKLYVNKADDCTEDLIKYINLKYEGRK